jgi:hypothetical protein
MQIFLGDVYLLTFKISDSDFNKASGQAPNMACRTNSQLAACAAQAAAGSMAISA